MNKDEMYQEMLTTKRHELIWSLAAQGYSHQDIADILKKVDRSNITRITNKMPEGWTSPWVKQSK